MLKLTKKADYGLISMKHLAVKHGSASAKEISDSYGIPLSLLSKILQKLARAGFLQSEHGTNGGYRLRRDPAKISALEIIRAIDGPVFLASCFTDHSCGVASKCNVREPLRKVHEGIQKLLADMTIADMRDDDEGSDCASEKPSVQNAATLTQLTSI
jgi:Rrf2 family protein